MSPAAPAPRILHIAETARGGVGTYLAELLAEQAALYGPDTVRALVPARDAGHITGVDRHLLRLWRRRRRSPLALLTLTRCMMREVADFRPDVIHAHSSFAGLLVRLVYGWRRHRPAIVYCPHGWGFDRKGHGAANRIARGIERMLAPWCDRIVAISDHERRQGLAAGILADKLALVLNGIADTPSPPPGRSEDTRLKLLFIGRLDHQKGFDTLLDAVAPLAGQVAVRAVGAPVAGGGPVPRRLRHVERLGWRSLSEVEVEIAAADVVVIPSRWEGFGLVALEAMRGGRAVIASAVGGLPEIVVEGVTGRLIAPDSPVRLMEALTNGTHADWRAMGRAGRARFLSLFTAQRMAAELADLYAALGVGVALAAAPRPMPRPVRAVMRRSRTPMLDDA